MATRTYAQQKAALTRALRSKDPRGKVLREVSRVKREWAEWGYWPDDWSRWERAMRDVGFLDGMTDRG